MTTTNNHAAQPEYYGGLEVDTRQNYGGFYADDVTKYRIADRNPSSLPQVHSPDLPEVSPYHDNEHSMPQAVGFGAAAGAAAAGGGAAAVADGNAGPAPGAGAGYESYYSPKENGNYTEVTSEEITQKRPATICGMKRKVFWIVLVVAIVIVVGAAVGGGVGGALAASNSSQQSSSSSGSGGSGGSSGSGSGTGDGDGSGSGSDSGSGSGDSSDSNNATSTINPTDIHLSSNIGAVNFTDEYGYENSLVFYQLHSNYLAQSVWNSSTDQWTFAYVSRESNIKAGTPISNSLFWHSKTIRDIRIYYLNSKNQVVGQVTNPVSNSWDRSGVSEQWTAGDSSQLLSNGIYSNDSYLSNLVMYQDSGSTLRVLRRTGGSTEWSVNGISTSFGKPADGTGLALVPIYSTETAKKMNLIYTSNSGVLTALTLTNVNDWTGEPLPTTLTQKNASIAAFSAGYENNGLTIHVLAAQPDKPPVLTVYAGGDWKNEGEIASMSGEDRPFKITANLAGRVYGLVQRNSTKVEIMEWQWAGGTTYNKIGTVKVFS